MTLVIDELYPGVVFEQTFKIKKSIQLAHLRPWIYKHGTPVGNLVIEVYRGETKLREATLSATDINAAISSTFAHGYVRFDFPSLLLNHDRKQATTEYSYKLFTTGTTKDSDNFLGAVRQYEAPVYPRYGDGLEEDGSLINDMISPAGFELYKVGY